MNEPSLAHAGIVRSKLKSRTVRAAGLYDMILSIPFVDRDAWIDEALGFDAPPPDVPDLPRGSVPYVPCGVDDILAMATSVPLCPDDELVDVGCGLGRVVILAHLLSGAAARGVEIQEPLIRRARDRCADLRLSRVSFVHANALDADLDGTVFFLYAPCNGEMLTRVVGRLERVAQRRPIVVCTVGFELQVPWLGARPRPNSSLTVYDSLPCRVSARRFHAQPMRSAWGG